MTVVPAAYPARLAIDYPEGARNRLTVAFRILWVIPIAIVLGGLGALFLPVLLMILFRRKYPMWWFSFNYEMTRFSTRVCAYLALLADAYPSTDDEQSVHLELDYPDVERDLNRWLPLVKWLLAIPHFVVLFFLAVAAFAVTVIAWFAILFTGKHPQGLFTFVVGVMRWGMRVEAYALLLTTDKYPPFSLD